ncbi:glycosyltransferase family 59 protein [Coniophora puteana RWD-64-598 SS2]|uniref:Dol-P-Glc:Glc(2)Man(9)GlcNAc(2)-PP-Dol alpha-1,2-glucosyltransferase n=1 Tax=Coniophora puteana (strain RWD-64-598) TaxID=741705 RepID=A0A5M3N5E6_CONPW|nr:glycosyltransferase family 59 protein [Coniophora puteana RWD-64-598 SS2]EIW86477.1 glycosyltransferase family 59 protein [Coniophora puteana RWD-64-598 SS2]
MSSESRLLYVVYAGVAVTVLKEMNTFVMEPYMDEPFHIPQAIAYCKGEWSTWDPKITTPPGLYIWSVLLHRIFMFRCTIPMLRLTTTLTLLGLPVVVSRLLAFHQRVRPPPLLEPRPEALAVACFPIAWFFGFLYYTEVPSLVAVLCTVVAASQNRHGLAALLGALSCLFRQTNIVWVLYAYAASQLMRLRFKRAKDTTTKLHDPPALEAGPLDLLRSVASAPYVLSELARPLVPYTFVLALFGAFVWWNGGIVLGDKSNHVPVFHVPQLFYFVAFSTVMGWPALVFGQEGGGGIALAREVARRMRTLVTGLVSVLMAVAVHKFTIHHPFLLSDNRHYTFYVWRRIFMLHPVVPYLFIPGYQVCAWAWWLRTAQDQTLLQTLLLPILIVPTLLPTPLLEPRYFLIPYFLMRAQVVDMSTVGVAVEAVWYAAVNGATMFVFLYCAREGVGRFMW